MFDVDINYYNIVYVQLAKQNVRASITLKK